VNYTVTCPSCGFSYELEGARSAPRKTGYRSLSARFHGHCADIADQARDDKGDRKYTAGEVKQIMKWHAAANGLWRSFTDFFGNKQPISEALATQEEETAINRLLQVFADGQGYWLTEYIDSEHPRMGTYKSLAGRNYKEMKELNHVES
jgi:hypothetical protein